MSGKLTYKAALAVPGFADTANYWVLSLPFSVGKVSVFTWAVLWGGEPSGTPISDALQWVSDCSASGTVFIGHSLGCRILLHAVPPASSPQMILIAPALGEYSFLEPSRLSEWRGNGMRETFRPDPVTGDRTVLYIPYSYADEILALPSCPRIPVTATIILLSEDTRQNAVTRQHMSGEGTIVEVEGPHRWWENKMAKKNVCDAISHSLEL